MSCNIATWKTKKIAGLRIPRAALFRNPRTDWHPEIVLVGCEEFGLANIMDSSVAGTIAVGDWINITEISIRGEGSGILWNWIIEPALKESRGILEAACIWETGEIERVSVNDGVIKTEPVEL